MSHNILILLYHTFIAVIDNPKNNLVKLTECILNINLSILLIIRLYIFIIFAVCDVGYYQTASGSEGGPPTCTACPGGSTTPGTNSQSISTCGKNARITIPID